LLVLRPDQWQPRLPPRATFMIAAVTIAAVTGRAPAFFCPCSTSSPASMKKRYVF
jgi:hypothetical protein